jgi:hypothetical protein
MNRIRYFIKVAIYPYLLLCLAIGIAIFIGWQQPSPIWSTLLHFNECELPCWIGITPSQSTLAEAQQQIERVYGDQSIYLLDDQETSFKVNYRPSGLSFGIRLDTTDQSQAPQAIIYDINITFDDARNTGKLPIIGDLYHGLGEDPDIITHTTGLFSKRQQILVDVNNSSCNAIALDQEIIRILILDLVSANQIVSYSQSQMWQPQFGRCNRFVHRESGND